MVRTTSCLPSGRHRTFERLGAGAPAFAASGLNRLPANHPRPAVANGKLTPRAGSRQTPNSGSLGGHIGAVDVEINEEVTFTKTRQRFGSQRQAFITAG
jgi:hypothetical protein